MRVFTSTELRRRLSEVLDIARREAVLITRRGGDSFVLRYQQPGGSPFDVPGVRTKATTEDILAALRDSRAGHSN